MIVTVFLGVLVLAMVLGNALLFFVPKKPSSGPLASSPAESPETTTMLVSAQPSEFAGNNAKVESLVVDERIGLLNKRVSYLEGEILKLKNNGAVNNDSVVARKLFALEEFKRNAHIEVEALKERLSALRKELNLPEKEKKNNFEISDKKLHSLAFNQGKKPARV